MHFQTARIVHFGTASDTEDEAMCRADLSDVVEETLEEDKGNAQKKRPKKDADNEAEFAC